MNGWSKNPPPAAPFIICGCGRSGTTYLKSILDAHPDVFIPTESLFIVDYLRCGNRVPPALLSWLFFREPQLLSWYSGPRFQIGQVRDAIVRVHRDMAKEQGATQWGQKTPRFIRWMDLFDLEFPGIKWILIYRDPRAVAASMLKSKRHTYSVSRACRRWNRDNQLIIDILKNSKHKKHIYILKYEDFVTHFGGVLADVFKFLGLRALSPQEVLQLGNTPGLKGSRFEVNAVREGLAPQKKVIDRWKDALTEHQIRTIEVMCANGMETLGYHAIFAPSKGIQTQDKKVDWAELKDVLILFEYLLKWPSYLFFTLLRKICFLLCFAFSKTT